MIVVYSQPMLCSFKWHNHIADAIVLPRHTLFHIR